jgi:hypothetical protein
MPLHLDIDAHGRVVPRADAARQALADRAGRFVLLPSVGDLLIAQRTPAAGLDSSRPRCILAGDLAALAIADLIAFVHQSRLSGVLTVCTGGVVRSISFQDGEVRSAQSTAAGERIGEVAVRLGFATETQVAVAAAAEGPFGRALVDHGVLKPNDLYRCLHEQVVAVFHAILLSKSGTFALVDEEPERTAAPLSVNTQSLLMDGIRRIDELSLLGARIPGPEAYLRRREVTRPVNLRPTESALLALFDGSRTVAEIATAAHLNEFDATKVLFHLAEAGYVEAVAAPSAAVSPLERVTGIVTGMNEILRTVAGAVVAGEREAFFEAARAFLLDESNRWAPVLRQLSVEDDGSLDAAALERALEPAALAAVEPSALSPKVALEALREALFCWLFLAGERLPREMDESLAREVKRRLAPIEALA